MNRRSLSRKLHLPRRLPTVVRGRLHRGIRVFLVVGLLGLVVSCGGGESAPGTEASQAGEMESEIREDRRTGAEGGSEVGRGPGAEPGPEIPSPTATEVPEGGLETWVEEMRQRLEVIELDPRASYPDVLRLYNTHHGAIERFYGEGGELTEDAHPELAAAIQEQDSAFHELLELTGTTDYIERTHLLHAIRNVRLAMEEILDRARAAGVPMDPS